MEIFGKIEQFIWTASQEWNFDLTRWFYLGNLFSYLSTLLYLGTYVGRLLYVRTM